MSSVLITGSNRGIGLGLVRLFLEHSNPPKLIIATCRNPDAAVELKSLASKHHSLKIIKLDVDDIDGYPKLVETVSTLVGETGLNVLINNAAINIKKSREDLTWKDYTKVFHTNTIAPLFLSQALLPLIRKAATVNSDRPFGFNKAAIINITSFLGSVSINDGGYLAYRDSKAALNQSSRTLASEVKKDGILIANLHPGWVRTDMGGPDGTFSVEESTTGLLNVIYNLKESDHDTFLDFKGETIPW